MRKKCLPIILLFLCIFICIGAYHVIMVNGDDIVELNDIYLDTERESALDGIQIKGYIGNGYYRTEFIIEPDGTVKKELKLLTFDKRIKNEYILEPKTYFYWGNYTNIDKSLKFVMSYTDYKNFFNSRTTHINTNIRFDRKDINEYNDIYQEYQGDIYFTVPLLSNKSGNGIYHIKDYKKILASDTLDAAADRIVSFDLEDNLTVDKLTIINDRVIVIFYGENTFHINTYNLDGILLSKNVRDTSFKIEQINTYILDNNLIVILPSANSYSIYQFTCDGEYGCRLSMEADAPESLCINELYYGKAIEGYADFKPFIVDKRIIVVAMGNLDDENSGYITSQPYIHVFSNDKLIYSASINNDIYEDKAYLFEYYMIEQARKNFRYINVSIEEKGNQND